MRASEMRIRAAAHVPNLGVTMQVLLMAARKFVRRTIRTHYRPEIHYMRGPGPKTREKQQTALPTART